MDTKAKEKGILKLEPRPRSSNEATTVLTPQGSYDLPPSSPHPSVDRLSVTWADPNMASPGSNSEVKFSPNPGEASEDEDYSVSLSAVLRQRRASVRRSRKGRGRRPSSPFLPEDNYRPRRRSSVFTTSSGDTAISIDEPVVTQEQIFQNIHLHKEVLSSVKQQPLCMRRKLKIVQQAKAYIKRHEGQLQERLAQSKSTRDIYARFNILLASKWQQMKREAANTSNLLIPWELRIKEIESHFGSVVASYFTFLRWLFWVNLVIGFILLVFVIVPEYLTANPKQDGERKIIMEDERRNATNLLTLWEFEGVLKYSPIFYGYYSNIERPEYKMPLAYFLTGLVVYVYSFVAILRKMAENSRMSKLSEKDDECIFSWKLFTGWDFMIGNTETAHNRIASVILGFKEALLEEAEKKKNLRNWRTITMRAFVNICVIILLALSAYAVVTVVTRSDNSGKEPSWWRENETTIVVTVISIIFPFFFELMGYLEAFHPRNQLRLQLARIMMLNLLNLYSLIFALFSKIDGMSRELVLLQPTFGTNATLNMPYAALDMDEQFSSNTKCFETAVPCLPCHMISLSVSTESFPNTYSTESAYDYVTKNSNNLLHRQRNKRNIIYENTVTDEISVLQKELQRLRNLSQFNESEEADERSESYDYDFYDTSSTTIESDDITKITTISITNEQFTTMSTSEYDVVFEETTLDELSDGNFTISSENEPSTTENSFSPSEITHLNEIYISSKLPNFSSKESSFTSSSIIENTETDTTHSFETTQQHVESTDYLWSSTAVPDIEVTTFSNINTENDMISVCPDTSFSCSINCGGKNMTQTFFMSNCTLVDVKCSVRQCVLKERKNKTDTVYFDHSKRKMYNLTIATRKKLLKLCWETMFGQELVKLTMMDLVFVLLGTLFLDFFRALFVRYMNRCWCWDLEKKFPEYGDFKIAENILHLINNQGMVWMGMFFSPGLVVLNVFKLMIMMYLRSWAVMTCNVPHEVVFRVSKSNNFYLGLLLTMLFLCVLPVGYTIVWVKPSWHCGPFSEYDKMYKILTSNIYSVLPKSLNFALEYIASPAIVIPLLVLLILIIYYLTSLTNSLREANNDLKTQLRRERTEERKKIIDLVDTRRQAGSSSIDNTPFGRWKKALPTLPINKSIDSEDRKAIPDEENSKEPVKTTKRKGGIFAKIVNLALDRKATSPTQSAQDTHNGDDETDTDFHETLPTAVLKSKDITVIKKSDKSRSVVDFKTHAEKKNIYKDVAPENSKEQEGESESKCRKLSKKQTSESSNQSKQSDSISSVIPVITISTTESDEEILQHSKTENTIRNVGVCKEAESEDKKQRLKKTKNSSDLKSLQRQSSVESINDNKVMKGKREEGYKYQYSL